MADQVKNFAYGLTNAAVAIGATSFSVKSGEGARFPATSGGAYNLVVYNPIYPDASKAFQSGACEIVRVTTRATDAFSVITRAQEGTTAIAWGENWRVELNPTAKIFTDITAQTAYIGRWLGALGTGTSGQQTITDLASGDMYWELESDGIVYGTSVGLWIYINGNVGWEKIATTP